MTDQIGRADYVLGTDISGVKSGTAEAESEILKSGARTEAEAKSRAERVGNVIGNGIKVVAGVSTLAFGIAVKGQLELQAATADYRAETGATADEAERAGKAINAMSGRNIQGIKEIGSALTKVHTNLGLTGDEADKVTERFLKFARATKQDAGGAVIAFDDILDAWGLTAKDAGQIMDKLIVSHQKYGGSIEANQAALAKMAPQLRALNLTIDDGIGLLNLFASSGLDAADGQKALNSAITKLPKGESLDQFLVRLSKIKDDGARAQEAMKVFGTRAGAGLANAIRPGIDSLDNFKVSTVEATGATEKAADALDSTFSAQVQLKIKAIGAAINEIGPGITGISSALSIVGSLADGLHLDDLIKKAVPALVDAARAAGAKAGDALSDGLTSIWQGAGGTVLGNNIATRLENILDPTKSTLIGNAYRGAAKKSAIIYGGALKLAEKAGDAASGAWSAVAKSGPVLKVAGFAGGIAGGVYGAAAGASEKLIGAIAGAWAKVPGSGTINAAASAAGAAGAAAFAGGATLAAAAAPIVIPVAFVVGLKESGGLDDIKEALNSVIFSALAGGDTAEGNRRAKEVRKFEEDMAKSMGHGAVNAIEQDLATIQSEVRDRISGAAKAAQQAAAASVAATVTNSATLGITGRDIVKWASGLGDRVEATLKAFRDQPAFIAKMHRLGLLSMGAVADGIKEKRQLVVDAFDGLVEMLKHPQTRTKEIAYLLGHLASKSLRDGLHSGDPAIRAQAQYTKGVILERLEELHVTAGVLSKKAAASIERALKSKDPDIRAAAQKIKNDIAAQLKSPADHAYGWGRNAGTAYADGLKSTKTIIRNGAVIALGGAQRVLEAFSPPGPDSPLHDIDKWGANTMAAYGEGIVKGGAGVTAALKAALDVSNVLAAPGALKFATAFGVGAAMAPASFAAVSRRDPGERHVTVTIGELHLHDVGSDVSPAAARTFSQSIMDTVGRGLRDQAARQGDS